MGVIIALSGSSGVGKSALIRRMLNKDLGLSYLPSSVTRSPRVGESQGNPYNFITPQEFAEKEARGDFVETEEVNKHWYGTDKLLYANVLNEGGSVIKDITVHGALRLREIFGDAALLVYIAPPSYEELERRLLKRGSGTEEENALRLSRYEMEERMSKSFDHIIVNDDFNSAANQLELVIRTSLSKG